MGGLHDSGWIHGWVGGWRINGWMEDGWMGRCVDGWMNGWLDGCLVAGWIDGWMGSWVNCVYLHRCRPGWPAARRGHRGGLRRPAARPRSWRERDPGTRRWPGWRGTRGTRSTPAGSTARFLQVRQGEGITPARPSFTQFNSYLINHSIIFSSICTAGLIDHITQSAAFMSFVAV